MPKLALMAQTLLDSDEEAELGTIQTEQLEAVPLVLEAMPDPAPAILSPELASRGACLYCTEPVMGSQERFKVAGGYYHAECHTKEQQEIQAQEHATKAAVADVSRGPCLYCTEPVMGSQERFKCEGGYYHADCHKKKVAGIAPPGAPPPPPIQTPERNDSPIANSPAASDGSPIADENDSPIPDSPETLEQKRIARMAAFSPSPGPDGSVSPTKLPPTPGSPSRGGGKLSVSPFIFSPTDDAALGLVDDDSDPYTLIFSKVRHGHTEAVQQLLAQGVAVDGRDKFGNTPLMVAAQNGSKKMIKLLVRNGCSVNLKNGQGNTALHFCLTYGFKKLGDTLIRANADPNAKNRAGMLPAGGAAKAIKAVADGEDLDAAMVATIGAGEREASRIEAMKLTLQIKSLKEDCADLTKERDQARSTIAQHSEESESAKAAAAAAESRAVDLKARFDEAAAGRATAEGKLQAANDRLAGLEGQVAANSDAAAAAQINAKSAAAGLGEQLGELQEQIKQAAASKKEAEEKFDTTAAAFTEQRKSLEGQLNQANTGNKELEDQLKLASAGSAQQVQSLQSKLDVAASAAKELEEKLAASADELQASQAKFDESDTSRKMLEDQLKLASAGSAQQVQTLQGKLDEAASAAKELEETLAASADQVEKLDSLLTEAEDSRKELEDKLSLASAGSAQQVTSLQSKLDEAESELKAAEKKLTAATAGSAEHVQALQMQLEQSATRRKEVEQKLSAAEELVTVLQNEHAALERKATELTQATNTEAAVASAQKGKLTELTTKWSTEVMERKKAEDNLKMKVMLLACLCCICLLSVASADFIERKADKGAGGGQAVVGTDEGRL